MATLSNCNKNINNNSDIIIDMANMPDINTFNNTYKNNSNANNERNYMIDYKCAIIDNPVNSNFNLMKNICNFLKKYMPNQDLNTDNKEQV